MDIARVRAERTRARPVALHFAIPHTWRRPMEAATELRARRRASSSLKPRIEAAVRGAPWVRIVGGLTRLGPRWLGSFSGEMSSTHPSPSKRWGRPPRQQYGEDATLVHGQLSGAVEQGRAARCVGRCGCCRFQLTLPAPPPPPQASRATACTSGAPQAAAASCTARARSECAHLRGRVAHLRALGRDGEC
eukprot:360019-Chlamydomonas_euryale.AAC.10